MASHSIRTLNGRRWAGYINERHVHTFSTEQEAHAWLAARTPKPEGSVPGHADFTVSGNGTSIVVVTPLTPAAREWVEENVSYESWQQWCGGIAVDHRMAQGLVAGIADAGFSIEEA